jgi:small subunit ribosomal protein S17
MESRKTGKVEKSGKVLSSKMDKSRIVLVESRVKHPFYKKFIKRRIKVMVHDEANISVEGDTVRIMRCRPLSKRKRWTVREVIEKRGQNGATAVGSNGS